MYVCMRVCMYVCVCMCVCVCVCVCVSVCMYVYVSLIFPHLSGQALHHQSKLTVSDCLYSLLQLITPFELRGHYM